MEKNVTNNKGDIGVTQVIADLNKHNIKVAIPLSPYLPFDLIAISPDGRLSRLSVKYKKQNKSGSCEIPLRTISYNSNGATIKYVDKNTIDGLAVFCPETNRCYYIPKDTFLVQKTSINLRMRTPLKNNGSVRFHLAQNFENPLNLWRWAEVTLPIPL